MSLISANPRPHQGRKALAFLLTALLLAPFLAATTPARADSAVAPSVQLRLLKTLNAPFVINRLAWHPDNRQLATAQNLNKTILVWNTGTGQVIRVIDKEVGGVDALAYSPDGKYLAVGRNFVQVGKPHVHLYDAQGGQLIRSFVPPKAPKGSAGNDASALAFSPDSRYLATRGYGGGGTAVVYSIVTGEVIVKLGDGTGLLYSLAFSPDGKYLAIGRSDRKDSWVDKWGRQVFSHVGRIELWSTDSWKVARRITIPSPNAIHFTVPAVVFSLDNKHLASAIAPAFGGSRDDRTGQWVTPEPIDRIKLWNASTTAQVKSFASNHIGSIKSLRFSADGRLLLTGGGDKIIEIWSIDSGMKLQTLDGFAQVVYFSLDRSDTVLATVSGKEIKLWELAR